MKTATRLEGKLAWIPRVFSATSGKNLVLLDYVYCILLLL